MEYVGEEVSLLGEEDPLYIVGEQIQPLFTFLPAESSTTARKLRYYRLVSGTTALGAVLPL